VSAIAFARLPELFAPMTHLLASGGDARLRLDPETRLNGYGCRPYPRPEAFTFASSTATSISERAYAAAERARDDLVRGAARVGLGAAVDAAADALRDELARLLGIERSGAGIVFAPSGTDAALVALAVARALMGTPLTSVIAAADETGSGVALACGGRHFSTLTAHGVAVEKGAAIAGLAEGVLCLPVLLRAAEGALAAAADAAVMRAVADAVAAGGRVLLHVMDHSKLGARSPSAAGLAAIEARFGAAVQVVIDACQMRLSRARLAAHLARGHLVLITGSKFFTGPPFSGALLVPAALGARLAALGEAPPGLADYASRSDWPGAWPGIRGSYPERGNLGQLLRWVAASREMRDYFAVPFAFRRAALARFAERVPALITAAGFEPLSDDAPSEAADEEMAVRTIFPFRLRRGGAWLAPAECAVVYRALNADVAPLLGALSPEDERLARQLGHIGQPVALADGSAALRISAGARVVSETWSRRSEAASLAALEREFEQIRTILAKIGLLLTHFERVAPAFAPRKEAAA
jgi:hypothetical protein